MVTRFEFSQFAGIETVEDGDYVLHSDYAALAESHARLLGALKAMNAQFGYGVSHPAGMVHDEHAAIQRAIEAIAAAQPFAEK
jgi:hypothetical protein